MLKVKVKASFPKSYRGAMSSRKEHFHSILDWEFWKFKKSLTLSFKLQVINIILRSGNKTALTAIHFSPERSYWIVIYWGRPLFSNGRLVCDRCDGDDNNCSCSTYSSTLSSCTTTGITWISPRKTMDMSTFRKPTAPADGFRGKLSCAHLWKTWWSGQKN